MPDHGPWTPRSAMDASDAPRRARPCGSGARVRGLDALLPASGAEVSGSDAEVPSSGAEVSGSGAVDSASGAQGSS